MPFYHYPQNNSGGSFTGPAHDLIVEADYARQADVIAQQHGVYFDHEYEIDCRCCGRRWHEADEPGDDEPLIYGLTPEDYVNGPRFTDGLGIPTVMTIFADGRKETVG